MIRFCVCAAHGDYDCSDNAPCPNCMPNPFDVELDDDCHPYYKCSVCGQDYTENYEGDCGECTILHEIWVNCDC